MLKPAAVFVLYVHRIMTGRLLGSLGLMTEDAAATAQGVGVYGCDESLAPSWSSLDKGARCLLRERGGQGGKARAAVDCRGAFSGAVALRGLDFALQIGVAALAQLQDVVH